MIKKLIVGSGFSASITNLLLDKQTKIFSINDYKNLSNYINTIAERPSFSI